MKSINFAKYQGIGNDFIIIDSRGTDLHQSLIVSNKKIVSNICDRHFGVGADGLILLMDSNNGADARMEIFNSDGTIAEMCGNGIRCLANYIKDQSDKEVSDNCIIQTLAGNIMASFSTSGNVIIDMGTPNFIPLEIPTNLKLDSNNLASGDVVLDGTTVKVYAASMGNPHAITYVDNIESIPFKLWGRQLENHSLFPNKTNVHFVEIINRAKLRIKVWERSCGATLACGTGACAVLAVTSRLNLCNKEAEIQLPGGSLDINWPSHDGSIFMSGPAKFVYSGNIDIDLHS